MKSRTSYFNTTIFKKNAAQYWPLWVLYLSYLLSVIPITIWLSVSRMDRADHFVRTSKPYYNRIIADVIEMGLSPIPIFLFSAIMAAAVFSYLYKAKSANMIHSFPVNRLELYVTNYASGLSFLLIPEIITFIVAVLVCMSNQVTSMQHLFVWLVYCAGMTFFAYSLAVFVVMLTGQIFAMLVYYLIVNYLYVGCLVLVGGLIDMVSYGVSYYLKPGRWGILSPMYYLPKKLYVHRIFVNGMEMPGEIEIRGGMGIGIYAAAAIVIVAVAYQLYKHRRIETAGDFISIPMIKPVFRWGMALGIGISGALFITGIFSSYMYINRFVSIVLGVIVFGSLGFFLAEALMQKSFRVFGRKRLLECGSFAILSVMMVALLKMDVLGIEHYVPREEEIEAAFVKMDYPMHIEGEEVLRLLEIHQEMIESRDEYQQYERERGNANKERGEFYVTFRYYMKDGSVVERNYPAIESFMEDVSTPIGKILEWEQNPDKLKTHIFGRNYEKNTYYSGGIDFYYGKNGMGSVYDLNQKEIQRVVDALIKDIDTGNIADYYNKIRNAEEEDDQQSYYNTITLYSKDNIFMDWAIYDDYWYYKKEGSMRRADSSSNLFIDFGPKCVNLIRTLEELGILNDTRKLITYDELMVN